MKSNASVFVAYASLDASVADELAALLERGGMRCWQATRDIAAGAEWAMAIRDAIHDASIVVVIISKAAVASAYVARELELATAANKPIIPVAVPSFDRSNLNHELSFLLAGLQWFEWSKLQKRRLVEVIRGLTGSEHRSDAQPLPPKPRSAAPAKGYVFISYSSQDKDFIDKFKTIIKRRNYGYWDYSESQRDYHSALYKELEQRIEGAAAFICIVSDSWRDSEWPAAEYLYARDAQIPVFVLIAKPLTRPVPILLIQQTRIDFSHDFDKAAGVLEHELDRKNL
jgi:hypothetical protein